MFNLDLGGLSNLRPRSVSPGVSASAQCMQASISLRLVYTDRERCKPIERGSSDDIVEERMNIVTSQCCLVFWYFGILVFSGRLA